MLNYNAGGTTSDIDGAGSGQMNTFFWLKKALIEAKKEQYFSQLASVENMPKHFGKTIKVYEYVPLLDDRNINDMGLDAAGAVIANGNLYGSSKDIGTITTKLPVLTENGGRVNRVGFTRLQREGSISKFGFFHEFTQESMDFDSDVNGAHEITEDVLQRDLLAAAGVEIFAGSATDDDEITGVANRDLVTYQNLMRLDQTLTDNRTPKHTKVITGSRLVDTKTIPSARVLYIGSELVPVIKGMTDLFDNPAFIPVQQYADAGTVLTGEIGTVDSFRVIEVPEMLHWAGAGAAEGVNPGYRASSGNYDVFPLLCIGNDSFATIGFQTDGKTVKFNVITKMPGNATADRNDPYGETGFSSIKWYYGFLAKRPERIGVIKTIAPL
jgi:N4-gp56 family major capsid protein